MSTRLALVVSIVLAIVAAVGVQAWIKGEKEAMKRGSKLVGILVASKFIPANTQLKEEMFAGKYVAKEGVVGDLVQYDERRRYIGHILTRSIPKAESIHKRDITMAANMAAGGQRILQDGMCATAIRVSQEKAAGFLIRPGDYVVVLGTFDVAVAGNSNRPSGRQTETRTVCLLPRVKVLAVDSRTQDVFGRSSRSKTTPYRSITLEVKPEDGARLTNAQREGELHMMLLSRSGNTENSLPEGKPYRWDKK